MRKLYLFLSTVLLSCAAWAQRPNDSGTYYQAADGQKGSALKTALFKIITHHTDVGYDGLWDVYAKSDMRPDGTYWDMYSCTTKFKPGDNRGNYSKEGDMVNREHTVPQSWFSKANPMKSDAFHVVPTDGYVNNRRSNYPYGEVNNPTYSSNQGFSKVGPCATEGYTGTVFEPDDEYKGDLARGYFYMATAYEDKAGAWGGVFGEGTYPSIVKWQLDMLLRWAANDPVSQKEIDRNNAICEFQKNRNPFIDYPGLEQYIWGTMMEEAFSYDNYNSDINTNPEPEPEPGEPEDPDVQKPTEGEVLFHKVTKNSDLQIGEGYILVCETKGMAMGKSEGNYRAGVAVTVSGEQIATKVNLEGFPVLFTLGGAADAYTLKLSDNEYLGLNSNKNNLHTNVDGTADNAKWSISISGGNAIVANNAYPNRSIQWNASAPRFATYSSSQTAVQLYRMDSEATGIGSVSQEHRFVSVYSVGGTLVRRAQNQAEAMHGLKAGLYIVNGQKVIVQ